MTQPLIAVPLDLQGVMLAGVSIDEGEKLEEIPAGATAVGSGTA